MPFAKAKFGIMYGGKHVMIKHVVFFKMKDMAEGKTGSENALELASRFRIISKSIPGVISCETGTNFNSEKVFYELCLHQAFTSREALQAYLAHPLHMAVREFVFQVIDHRIVVDYDPQ